MDKRINNRLERVCKLYQENKYKETILSGKKIIDSLIVIMHDAIYKKKTEKIQKTPTTQLKKVLSFAESSPETKKIIGKKSIKSVLKWYNKFQEYQNNPESKPAKKPEKFGKKTLQTAILLQHSSVKVKAYFQE